MIIIILLAVILVANVTSDNPFEFENNGIYYSSKYREKDNVTILLMHTSKKSDILITVGNRVVGTFNLAEKKDNISLKIYSMAYNPSLNEEKPYEKVKLLCEFAYPITVVAGSDSYQCSMVFKDKLNQLHYIGKCSLNLLRDSSFCIIHGSINTKLLSNKYEVKVLATIYYCRSPCSKNNNPKWNGLLYGNITLPLVSFDHIIWMKAYFQRSINIGLLIGVPKNPMKVSDKLELPLKLKNSVINKQIKIIVLQVYYHHSMTIEDILPFGGFQLSDSNVYENYTEIELTKREKDQWSNIDPDLLCILQVSATDEIKGLSLQIIVANIMFNDKLESITKDLDKDFELNTVNIPLFQGVQSVIPVIKNLIITPSFESANNEYYLQSSDIKIYYAFEESQSLDVTRKVKCRPFNISKLKCPPNMLTLKPILTSVENPESLQWSLELLIDEMLMIVTVKPLMIPKDSWDITFSDSVLNVISGWMTPKSIVYSLTTDVSCGPIYQVSSIQIYKKIILYNERNNETTEIVLDMSERLRKTSILISNNKADLYMIGKKYVIQGKGYGDFRVEILDHGNSTLARGDMTVYNDPVYVTDLDISCISDIKILNRIVFSSAIMTIADFNFKYQNFNNSHNCFFIIYIIFSDKSKTNLFLFPKYQYSLRFITNTKIIEVFDVEGMWYNSIKFNNQQSFHVELQESKYCENPKTIWNKHITLSNVRLEHSGFTSTHSAIIKNSSVSSMKNMKSTKATKREVMDTSSIGWMMYALIGVVVIILIIILINIIIKYNKSKNSSARFNRRKSLNEVELSNMTSNIKDYPPLLPPPGPQVQLSDTDTVAISSPHSFWSNEPNKVNLSSKLNPFIRQSSLPVKRCSSRGYNEIVPCPPLRWANEMINGSSTVNTSNSQEVLNTDFSCDLNSFPPMTWSVTHMDVDESSGVGSLNTNMDDLLKDPYDSEERFHKLSELPYSNTNKKQRIYEMV